MASMNYTQSIYNQSNSLPLMRVDSISASAVWDTLGDFNYCPETLINYEAPVFEDDSETTSTVSTLCTASKKITKASPACNSQKTASRRHKRARNPWTTQEDAKLMELMKKYGQSWAMISSCLPGRTGKQVRDRYLNKLRPNIKCGDWSVEEDELLVKLCKEVGNKWSLIATHLPGRTEGQVKNRYYSSIKKRLLPNGELAQATNTSRATSEDVSSFAASPRSEEVVFDFETNGFNECQIFADQTEQTGHIINSKASYIIEEAYSEESTTQSSQSQKDSESPLRVDMVDPTDVISYDLPNGLFRFNSVQVPRIQIDSQVDQMLNNVTNYYTESTSQNVDYFFANDAASEDSSVDINERYSQLAQRKAYLELALAKTLKEMKGF